MSSISAVPPEFDPIPDVARLLAHGALVITQSRDACNRSRRARGAATLRRQEALDLILRFSPQRVEPISGGDGFTEGTDPIRTVLRAFAMFGTPKTFVGLGRGAICNACGRDILRGEIEYEVVANGHEMRLDSSCYLVLVDELATLPPRSASAS